MGLGRRNWSQVGTGLLLVGLLCAVTVPIGSYLVQKRLIGEMYKDQKGRTAARIQSELGKPRRIFRSGDPAYPVSGYAKPPPRPFSQCWVYYKLDLIAYVYFDDRSVCQSVFVGGG